MSVKTFTVTVIQVVQQKIQSAPLVTARSSRVQSVLRQDLQVTLKPAARPQIRTFTIV